MKGFLAFVLCLSVANSAESEEEWKAWKTLYGKKYFNDTEEQARHAIWRENLKKIQQHNSEGHSFNLSMNHFGDLTLDEYRIFIRRGLLFHFSNETERRGLACIPPSKKTLPPTVDWRTKGYVTRVKDQGSCGSCWAFSATGSLEGQHFKKKGQLVPLSEQNLVDCSRGFGNEGCKGGLMNNAFRYIIANGGIDTEASYLYSGKKEQCRFKEDDIGATVTDYVNIKRGSEADLQCAVATVGPISVAIDASYKSFQFYKTGVYSECACTPTNLSHAVVVVGYGTYHGQDYWLVKNSWGTKWGEEGYIKMSRNKNNQCGIATMASYPIAGCDVSPTVGPKPKTTVANSKMSTTNPKDCIFPMVAFYFLTVSFTMLYSQ